MLGPPRLFNRTCVLSKRNFKIRRGPASVGSFAGGSASSFVQEARPRARNSNRRRWDGAWGWWIERDRKATRTMPGPVDWNLPQIVCAHTFSDYLRLRRRTCDEARRDDRLSDPQSVEPHLAHVQQRGEQVRRHHGHWADPAEHRAGGYTQHQARSQDGHGEQKPRAHLADHGGRRA